MVDDGDDGLHLRPAMIAGWWAATATMAHLRTGEGSMGREGDVSVHEKLKMRGRPSNQSMID